MLFKIHYDVPANTLITSQDWQKLKVAKGRVIEWLINMPTEGADLLQFRVEYHGVQLLPFTRNEFIYGISQPTLIHDNILIDVPPYELDIYSINLDDSYNHEFNLYVNILPDKPVTPGEEETPGWWNEVKRLLGVD